MRVFAAILAALATPPAPAAEVELLTYNVAGILVFSESNPVVNTKLISPLLEPYELVLVQEDFHFHDDLVSRITHEHQSTKDWTGFSGDGLNTFSRSPFSGFERVTWNRCHGLSDAGNDCWAPKGFTFARHEAAPGLFVDVYDLHADAGNGWRDRDARSSQLAQLGDHIFLESFGRAVIVLGDFNARYTELGETLPILHVSHGFRDAWVELHRGGVRPPVGPRIDSGCKIAPGGPDCELVDKVLYRSGEGVSLAPLAYDVPSNFVDALGCPLSDHHPVAVKFELLVVP
jgi:endonuclease/exonuclease/phosphatase family metal-dependent hydrolase